MRICVVCGREGSSTDGRCTVCGNEMPSPDPSRLEPPARPASRAKRVLAGLVDALVVGLCTYLVVHRLGLKLVARPRASASVAFLVLAALPALYAVLRDAVAGRSLGKALFGLVVFNEERARAAGVRESVLRNAVYGFVLVPVVGWLLGLLFALVAGLQLLSGRPRRLGEGLCPEASVVEERGVRLRS